MISDPIMALGLGLMAFGAISVTFVVCDGLLHSWTMRRRLPPPAGGGEAETDRLPQIDTAALNQPPKPRVRMTARGNWIRHDGKPFPLDGRAHVEIVMQGGRMEGEPEPANRWPDEFWCWGCPNPRFNILFYRLIDPALLMPGVDGRRLPA